MYRGLSTDNSEDVICFVMRHVGNLASTPLAALLLCDHLAYILTTSVNELTVPDAVAVTGLVTSKTNSVLVQYILDPECLRAK